ncbi:MAG: hypothetical protein ACNA8R_09900 [Nitriliruptoraceae bacterium]
MHDRITDLRRWPAWSPWEHLDPDLERTCGGAATGVGAWYEGEGNRKAGKGRMEIVNVDPASVRLEVRFLKPFRSESTSVFCLRTVTAPASPGR